MVATVGADVARPGLELSARDARAAMFVFVRVPLRATTRRFDVFVAGAATVRVPALFADVAARAVPVPVLVAARAVRGTTRREPATVPVLLVRAIVEIWLGARFGLCSGANRVRILLFMYGYMLLYVFALI